MALEQDELVKIYMLCKPYIAKPGATVMMLHAIVDEFKYIPFEAMKIIADLNHQQIDDIYDYVSYYNDVYSLEKYGKHHIEVCMGKVCNKRKALDLLKYLCERYNCPINGTSNDGFITIHTHLCINNCSNGPHLKIDGKKYELMTIKGLEYVLKELNWE